MATKNKKAAPAKRTVRANIKRLKAHGVKTGSKPIQEIADLLSELVDAAEAEFAGKKTPATEPCGWRGCKRVAEFTRFDIETEDGGDCVDLCASHNAEIERGKAKAAKKRAERDAKARLTTLEEKR